MQKYDVIVVGAGTAGCLAGMTASELGSKVLMLDCKDFKDIGKKVCGDAIGLQHFKNAGLKDPPSDAIRGRMNSIKVYSPSGAHSYKVEGNGYALNRYRFGRWLLDQALDKGAELKSNTKVTSPIIEDRKIVGVKILDDKTGENKHYLGRVVVDASGWTGTIRRALPEFHGFVKEPDWGDVAVCYREVRELKANLEEPGLAKIYLNSSIAPRGYWWFFPQTESLLNIGIGVQGGLRKDPRALFKEHISGLPIIQGSKVIDAGGGVVPTRRSLHSIVAFGAIFAGDSGFTANPIHGGGIGPSMIAGRIAGRVAVESLNKDDPNKALWIANKEYTKAYGMKAAGLEVFKIFLQELSNEDLEFGMQKKLITESDLTRLSYGRGGLLVREKAMRIVRGVRRPSILQHLATVASYMKKVKKIYSNYPEEEDYEGWSESVYRLFSEFRKRIT
ncbi:MAG: geranylgeranyl reductase family protein [Nitrososphaerales archaeon]